MRLIVASVILALAFGGSVSAQPAPPSPAIAAALADPGRPAEDVARDSARKPGEILAFAEVKPGDKVADFIMGGGYFTRILAKTVGPEGRVYAYQPEEFIKFDAKYGANQTKVVADYPNMTAVSSSLFALTFPEPLDAIMTVQNYHDLHLKPFPTDSAAKINAALFSALKPGGVLLVVDHVAEAGSGFRDADRLHRIDPAAARAEIEAAGFKFEAETPILHRADDPHTANVFDAAIRGKTDQFAYRFRKPL